MAGRSTLRKKKCVVFLRLRNTPSAIGYKHKEVEGRGCMSSKGVLRGGITIVFTLTSHNTDHTSTWRARDHVFVHQIIFIYT